jgi:hypothetical protein
MSQMSLDTEGLHRGEITVIEYAQAKRAYVSSVRFDRLSDGAIAAVTVEIRKDGSKIARRIFGDRLPPARMRDTNFNPSPLYMTWAIQMSDALEQQEPESNTVAPRPSKEIGCPSNASRSIEPRRANRIG